jgi:hypothetical protein
LSSWGADFAVSEFDRSAFNGAKDMDGPVDIDVSGIVVGPAYQSLWLDQQMMVSHEM